MGLGSRVFLGLILGAIGGAVFWVSTDFLFSPISDPEYMLKAPLYVQTLYGGLIGGFLGASLGLADKLSAASRAHPMQFVARAAGSGLAAGAIGFNFANVIYGALGGEYDTHGNFTVYLVQCLIRAIGWSSFGLLLGGIYGALDTGGKKARNAAIGGAIGGFLAGLIFNPLATVMTDRTARLVSFIVLGAFIGFFTALVHILLRTAWVLVVYARNEGREIILEKAISHIGRNELAEIPLYRDGLIAANHAEIRFENNRYSIVDSGTVVGTSVNGQKIAQPTLLKDSDMIQVGNTQIVFYERATEGPIRRQVDLSQAAPAAAPVVPEGHCPFCGQTRDPITGSCACSVAPPAGGPNTAFASTSSPAIPIFGAPAPYSAPPTAAPYTAAPIGSYSPAGGSFPEATALVGAQGVVPALRLVGIGGAHAGESFPIGGDRAEIGRESSNAIPLVRDTTVSRRHAVIALTSDGWSVTDLGSSNGTFVNGARITAQALRPGDEVSFGNARFRLE